LLRRRRERQNPERRLRSTRFLRQNGELLALAAIVVAASVVRLVNLGYYSLWYDEIVVANHVRNAASLSELVESVRNTTGATPLHELVLSAFFRFSTSEFTARFPSFLAGVASVVAIHVLGRRVFNSQVGLLAALLLAFSPFHIQYSQEARFYAIFVLLAICSMIAFLRFVERRTYPRWIGLVVWHTLCLWSAYFAGFVMLFEGLYATYLVTRDRLSRTTTVGMNWRDYLACGAGLSLAVVLFLPWFFYARVGEEVSRGFHTALNWQWALLVLQPLSAGSRLSVAMFGLAFMAGLIYSVRLGRHEGVLLASIAVVSPFAVLLLVNHAGYFFAPRQLLFILPSFLLLVAAGIAGTAELLVLLMKRFPSRNLKATCAWAAALLIFVPLDAREVVRYHKDYRGTPDWKHATVYLYRNVGAEDVVVSMKAFDGAFCLEYYAPADLDDQIVDVKDLPEWQNRWRSLRGPDTLPRNVWFVSPKMLELDGKSFQIVAFPNLKIVRAEKMSRTWDGLWGLVAEQVFAASKTTGYRRGRVLSELGEMLAAVGKHASAYEVVRDLASQYPHMPNYQRQLGELAVKLGKLDVAEQAFRATLRLDPESYAFSQLADVLLRLGKRDEAVEVVRKAVAARDEPYRRTWLGLVYAVAGNHDRAEEEFRRAIAMAPNYAYAHYRFGQFCAARGRLDDAVSEYRTVLELEPANSAFGLLADVLLEMGRYDEAERVIHDAIAAKDEPYRRTRLGMVYAASGKYDLAEEEYLKAIAMQVDYEYAHYRLAQLHARLGRRDEAIAEFETVLRLVDPDSARAKAVHAELEKLRKGGPSGE